MTSSNSKWPRALARSHAAFLTAAFVVHFTAAGVGATRCYTCGPAATQVHRSVQPPSCDTLVPTLAATCDQTHPYCATVATTNPYSESRICSRHLYKECRYVHCERTNTSKMTCTCEGDLCNGEKDQRVTEAFQELFDRKASPGAPVTEVVTTAKASTVALKILDGVGKEFHNALEIDTPWPMSSESETAENLPTPGALRGENGGGEDDEDSSEGSGAALRSDSPRPLDSERTTTLATRTTPQHATETRQNNSVHCITPFVGAAAVTAAILVLT